MHQTDALSGNLFTKVEIDSPYLNKIRLTVFLLLLTADNIVSSTNYITVNGVHFQCQHVLNVVYQRLNALYLMKFEHGDFIILSKSASFLFHSPQESPPNHHISQSACAASKAHLYPL